MLAEAGERATESFFCNFVSHLVIVLRQLYRDKTVKSHEKHGISVELRSWVGLKWVCGRVGCALQASSVKIVLVQLHLQSAGKNRG